jgi:hypothetical protein
MLSTVFGATSLSAQDQASAQTFLLSIYKRYGKGGPGVNTDGSRARLYFSSSLVSLLRADQKAVGPDEVGVLDGDPICGCQDWDAIHDLKIALTTSAPGRLKAAVSFALFGSDAKAEQSVRSLEMTLVAHAGQWRIDNIVDKSDPKAPFDLRAELVKEIRQMKQRVSTTPLPRQTAPRY